MRYRAKKPFSTVVMHGGENLLITAKKGDELELEHGVAEAVLRDLPGYMLPATTAKAKPKVASKQIDKGKTRQVSEAPKRGRGKAKT